MEQVPLLAAPSPPPPPPPHELQSNVDEVEMCLVIHSW